MARKLKGSPTLFESLVKHLAEVEEQKAKLLETYFQESSREREELKRLVELYIRQVEALVREMGKEGTGGDALPFVTIGSEVEVEDLSTQEVHRFRLVAPFSGDVRGGDISYISPVGKALLLRRLGDEVTVHAPGGVFRYRVRSIRWRGN
ncbi:MAG: GreA/GreB family elongation factor [Clostridia bacterium]|jgi:transcription elongation factor GreA|nr:GreA/GreB family elongation factor [Clostridia bacterium]MDH7573642.1 GreA/GreB family elongation factor [Clostridia bacterium]